VFFSRNIAFIVGLGLIIIIITAFLGSPCVPEDKAMVEGSLNSIHLRASFLAASTHHSGDWLFTMSIASCGLTLDDEAVRVAVGLRLGLDLCVPHQYHCGSLVDARLLLWCAANH